MIDDLIDFDLPESTGSLITVIGVGGGGNNAVNRMYEEGIRDVEFMVANTDGQALQNSRVPIKVQLGVTLTEGRGAGNRVDVGQQAAIESINEILDHLNQSTKMVFLVAGMGGGTGTGAAPIIARACRDLKHLTVGVVTLPFRFEGPRRMKMAIEGVEVLKDEVDVLLIIHNEKLREIYGNKPLSTAFASADEILTLAVKGVAEIITIHGYINVDYADVYSVMREGGIAFMGSATASGPDRARKVIDDTINSPLLNNNDIRGASRVLLNITSGQDEITVDEIGVITDLITEKVGGRVNTIWGTCSDETLVDGIRITLVATGFQDNSIPEWMITNPPRKETIPLQTPPVIEEEKIQEVIKEVKIKKEKKPKEEVIAPVSEFQVIEKPARDVDQEILDRLRAFNYRRLNDIKNVDDFERVPAYKRKQIPVDDEKEEAESQSRYTIGSDARLRPNNSFLHDAVD